MVGGRQQGRGSGGGGAATGVKPVGGGNRGRAGGGGGNRGRGGTLRCHCRLSHFQNTYPSIAYK